MVGGENWGNIPDGFTSHAACAALQQTQPVPPPFPPPWIRGFWFGSRGLATASSPSLIGSAAGLPMTRKAATVSHSLGNYQAAYERGGTVLLFTRGFTIRAA